MIIVTLMITTVMIIVTLMITTVMIIVALMITTVMIIVTLLITTFMIIVTLMITTMGDSFINHSLVQTSHPHTHTNIHKNHSGDQDGTSLSHNTSPPLPSWPVCFIKIR
jgi:hypothetical protein